LKAIDCNFSGVLGRVLLIKKSHSFGSEQVLITISKRINVFQVDDFLIGKQSQFPLVSLSKPAKETLSIRITSN
jgi:hypothetical protein